ncbi:MAG: GNAT family N-acetyltransferase [Dehalococcoidia bacterium]|nr:GNAT family N-acetyltransferase [Dehalococcoidia bacterium]
MNPLEGELVYLRAAEREEREQVHGWLADPDVIRFNGVRYPSSLEGLRSRPLQAPGYQLAHFAVFERATGKPAGEVSLRTLGPENRCAELAVLLGPEARGRGLGTDTVRVACRFGFEMMNLHRIELRVSAANARARRTYEKAGFVVEGVRRESYYYAGRYDDEVTMGQLREEYDCRAQGRA